MDALNAEFDHLREATCRISWCQQRWWDNEALDRSKWVLIDAWYRSRSMELPVSGHAMVACLDLVNHSALANAFYEQSTKDEVYLVSRDGVHRPERAEITINYGAKSEAEMLFSYGFTDCDLSMPSSMVLHLEPDIDDPLGMAKAATYSGRRGITLTMREDGCSWESPFLLFSVLNEEDGLSFKVLQEKESSERSLRVFWHGTDVTDATDKFEVHIRNDSLKQDVYTLRFLTLLCGRLEAQLERIQNTQLSFKSTDQYPMFSAIDSLRTVEMGLLQGALSGASARMNQLYGSETVSRYLHSVQQSEHGLAVVEAIDEEDFS